MKIKLHKHYYKGFVYALLLVVSATSLFAAKYNEPRKVLYSIQKNALYRNLTVSGDMSLNTKDGDNRTFLMEIGKRPTYFWDSNSAMHLLQTQTFNINNISHNGNEDNILNIQSILVPQGVFLSEGGLLFKKMYLYSGATGSIIGLPNSISNNLLFTLDKNAKTHIKYHTNDLQLIAETSGTYDTNTPIIDYLRTRDLTYNGVNFVSPRMVITKNTNNNTYSANGTARAYLELVNLTRSGDMKSYYGDWEVYSVGACDMEEIKDKDEHVCRKWYNHKEGTPDPQGYDSGKGWVWDLSTDYFTCADVKKPSDSMEPGRYYDYVPESGGVVAGNYTCNDYLTTSSNVT
ncbi:MAG: hypothetical protein K6E94_04565, partial [Elusimicrobiaceae bacterium]|nr:hypothetical protein [Elusimicrobiaceae bacterium]